MTGYTVATYAERPDLAPIAEKSNSQVWPEFMLHDRISDLYWHRLRQDFPDFQFMLLDADDRLVSSGNSIPLWWDGDPDSLSPRGWDWAMLQGLETLDRGRTPNTLSAIQITVPAALRGKGISHEAVKALRGLAARHGFDALIAPVRPNQKSLYPLTPIDRYIRWTKADGAPFDAWLRVHWRLGAAIIKPCPESMTVEGTVAEWEEWTGLRFPESGPYIVPGALTPVEIDCEANRGRYVEPNVWMVHRIATGD